MNKNRIPESRDGARHKSPTNRLQPKKLLEGFMESLSPKQRDRLEDFGVWIDGCKDLALRTCSDVKAGIQYARDGRADRDYRSFGMNELPRMANAMRELAYNCGSGCPENYLDRRNWLNKHENDYEDWLDSHDVMSILDDERDYGRIPTLRELAEKDKTCIGNRAWRDDLVYAASILDEYQKALWHGYYSDFDLYGYDEAERRAKMIEARFREVWGWIGTMLPSMSD